MKSLSCLAAAAAAVAAAGNANAEEITPTRDGFLLCNELAQNQNFDSSEQVRGIQLKKGKTPIDLDEIVIDTVRRAISERGGNTVTAICEYERSLFVQIGIFDSFDDLLNDLKGSIPEVKGVHVCVDLPGEDNDKCFRDRYATNSSGELPEHFEHLTAVRAPDGLVDPSTGTLLDKTDCTAMGEESYYSFSSPRGEKFTGTEFADKQRTFRNLIFGVKRALYNGGSFIPKQVLHPEHLRRGNR